MRINRSQQLKNKLDAVIKAMDMNKDDYVMRPGIDFSRNRKIPFETTIKMILGMGANSLRKEIYDMFPDFSERMTPSAFVQQRSKIKPEAFEYAFNKFNAFTDLSDNKTHNGYHLFAIDGTALNIAKNPLSNTYFEQGFNQFHLCSLYDICNKTFKGCVIQPRPKMNENAACKEMVKRSTFPEKSIIIGDRLFANYAIYETINRIPNLDYLIRARNHYSTETKKLPMMELDVDRTVELRTTQSKKDVEDFKSGRAKWIAGPSKSGKEKKYVSWEFESPCKITMRIVRFELSSSEYETIVTSLSRSEFPLQEIKKLYAMRWGIETAFREIKYAMGMTNFHAIKEDFIIQEIYAKLLMYNFSMRIAMHVGLTKTDRKYDYQINFTHAMYVCVHFFRGRDGPLIEAEIASCILPIRPGRSDNRKIIPKGHIPFTYRVA
ncbi:MAG TPA: IS4 family transposase [Clostridiales bacterium]|nr:IS4 family transposase [Clostridiales bacterium]